MLCGSSLTTTRPQSSLQDTAARHRLEVYVQGACRVGAPAPHYGCGSTCERARRPMWSAVWGQMRYQEELRERTVPPAPALGSWDKQTVGGARPPLEWTAQGQKAHHNGGKRRGSGKNGHATSSTRSEGLRVQVRAHRALALAFSAQS